MTPEQALDKLKEKIILVLEHTTKEIKEAEINHDALKLSFNSGYKTAMENVIEDIYSDTIKIE